MQPLLQRGRRCDKLAPVVSASEARFADGLRYRIEIPSVEGPAALRAVVEEAAAREIPIRRVSQGSGVMMLTDGELRETAELGAEHGIEVSLFIGPRGAWDTGGQSFATGAVGGVARGNAGVEWCVAEVRRGLAFGIRSYLVADVGVLAELGRLKRAGDLPESLVLKTSVLLPCANPRDRAGARGARGDDDQRVHGSLSRRAGRAARRMRRSARRVRRGARTTRAGSSASTRSRMMIRAAAPVYVKLGIRNAPNIYPAGLHLADTAVKLARERVRRAELVVRLLRERAPELVEGRGDDAPSDLGIPEP